MGNESSIVPINDPKPAVDPVDFLIETARTNYAAFISAAHRPRYKHSALSVAVCRAVDQFVEDLLAGLRPILMLTSPPQHGKSSLIARCLPPYLFGRLTGALPAVRIASASYGHGLAQRNRRDAQSIMNEPIYRAIFPHTSLIDFKGIDNAADGLEVPQGGWLKGVGIGGALTGFSVDCFTADTLIDTDHGRIRIDELHMMAETAKVLTWAGTHLAYARIKAIGYRTAPRLFRITTHTGRVLCVTGNHPIYSAGRYIAASELTSGDVLLCAVQDISDAHGGGLSQVANKKPKRRAVLRQKMHGYRETNHVDELSSLRAAPAISWRQALRCLCKNRSRSKNSSVCGTSRNYLSILWKKIYVTLESGCGSLLRYVMQKRRAQRPDATYKQSEFQRVSGQDHCQATFVQPSDVSLCENSDVGPRQASVRAMCMYEETSRTSHRRESDKQFVLQFADTLRELSSPSAQFAHDRFYESDYVRKVEIIDGSVCVFDLQVETHACLFANGILAHNCGIIDDPTKNAQEALSEVIQERNRDWYDSVFLTRLQEHSGQVIIGTPWSANDLLAHIRRQSVDKPNFRLLSFPALNYPDEIGYRDDLPHGALVPKLHSETQLREIKSHMGEMWWAALYQQTPLADAGAIFKKQYVQYYKRADLPKTWKRLVISVDATFKDHKKSDYVAVGVWGQTVDDATYLLDWRREKLAFTATAGAIVDLRNKYPRASRIYIEDAANGPALIDMLSKKITGIEAVPPLGSKEARAHAVSWVWENRMVWLPSPEEQPGIVPVVAEITSFPDVQNDDCVDMMTIALHQLHLRSPIAAMITKEILDRARG